jgi:hypothetical protein
VCLLQVLKQREEHNKIFDENITLISQRIERQVESTGIDEIKNDRDRIIQKLGKKIEENQQLKIDLQNATARIQELESYQNAAVPLDPSLVLHNGHMDDQFDINLDANLDANLDDMFAHMPPASP